MTALIVILSICGYILIAKIVHDVGIKKDIIDEDSFLYPMHVIAWPVFLIVHPILKLGEHISKLFI